MIEAEGVTQFVVHHFYQTGLEYWLGRRARPQTVSGNDAGSTTHPAEAEDSPVVDVVLGGGYISCGYADEFGETFINFEFKRIEKLRPFAKN